MTETLVIGTAGHIDHGKTALVQALTGTDTDRLAEEKQRGITIDLGFAHARAGEREISFVDVPGHEAFVRNMVAGVSGVDAALLVVAADEGVMPQTREHIAILDFLDVRQAVVAISKCDLVEDAWIELVRDDVRDALAGCGFASARLLPVSARTGAGLEALLALLAGLPGRDREGQADDFRMPVDRAFTVHGTGTVLTGTVREGRLVPEQDVLLLPSMHRGRVRALQRHNEEVRQVQAGTRAAVAVAGVDRSAVRRGDTLVTGDSWRPSNRVTVRLRASTGHEIRHGQRVRVHAGTSEVMARIALLRDSGAGPGGDGGAHAGREAVGAGQPALAQLRLETPLVVRAGDPCVLRSYSPVTTVGGGVIIEPMAPRRSRHTDHLVAIDRALGRSREVLRALLAQAGTAGVERTGLALRLGVSPAEARAAEADALVLSGRVFDPAAAEPLAERARQEVRDYHRQYPIRPGVPHAELVAGLGRHAPAPLVEHVLKDLVTAGRLRLEEGAVAAADHEARPDPAQEKVLDRLNRLFDTGGYAPPTRDELPGEISRRSDLPDLLAWLERQGRLIAIGDGRWLSALQLDRLEREVRDALGGRDDLSPVDFRAVLPVSRRHLIPLLEFLDGRGVTRRRGDRRSVPA